MLRGPSEISSWFEKRFFLDAHESRFSVRVFLSLFFWVHKSISGNSHHVHQYVFIFLQRSFFKRVVLMRRAKSRRAEERPEQSRAMGRANEELFRRKEKSTRRISTLFSSFLLFWVLRLSGLFSLFFWVVSRVCTHFFAKKTERGKSHSRARNERFLTKEI